ncbi:thiamine-binding protein [Haloactinomyces albus]|uniref:Uncharacterized protein YqgV (UPF0045/DUF77 family) n=1 Tax=Haloactinomyces albus TaxID=1352928 RepID=A0AAE3ZCR7_9ACTN|nr:thiamine-binding protein [Haloactinomyces albus]MDR7302537.1 uncharacterized protein YqgV (UPF0045/DUF77 family) [Haloactinomyces albus]
MHVRAEFTTEPFEGEGEPPAHAFAARDSLRSSGLEPEFGPLGTAISGEREAVLPALASMLDKALDAGADRITMQVSIDDAIVDESAEEF